MTKLAVYFQVISKCIRGYSKKYDSGNLGELGRGSGKGGGGGGPIREAGGSFGKIAAAREEEYHYKLQQKLLTDLKHKLHEENNLRKEEIEMHLKVIEENKKMAKRLEAKFHYRNKDLKKDKY